MRKMLLAISLLQVLTVAEVNGNFEFYNNNSYEIENKKNESKVGLKTNVKFPILEIGADVETKSRNILQSMNDNSNIYLKFNYMDNYIKAKYMTKGETELEGNIGYEKYIGYNLNVKLPNNKKNIQLSHKISSSYKPIPEVEIGANILVNHAINSNKLDYKDLLFNEDKTLNNGILSHSYELYGKYLGIEGLELEAALLYQNVIEKDSGKKLYKPLWEQLSEYNLGVKKLTSEYIKNIGIVSKSIGELDKKIHSTKDIEQILIEEKNTITKEIVTLANELDSLLKKEEGLKQRIKEMEAEIESETDQTEKQRKQEELKDKQKELKENHKIVLEKKPVLVDKVEKLKNKGKELRENRLELSKAELLKVQQLESLREQYEMLNKYKEKSKENYKEYLAKLQNQKMDDKKINTHYFGTKLMAKYKGLKNGEFDFVTVLGGIYSEKDSKFDKYIKVETNAKYEQMINRDLSIIPEFSGKIKLAKTLDAILEPKLGLNLRLSNNLNFDSKISTPINFDINGYKSTGIKTDFILKYNW